MTEDRLCFVFCKSLYVRYRKKPKVAGTKIEKDKEIIKIFFIVSPNLYNITFHQQSQILLFCIMIGNMLSSPTVGLYFALISLSSYERYKLVSIKTRLIFCRSICVNVNYNFNI